MSDSAESRKERELSSLWKQRLSANWRRRRRRRSEQRQYWNFSLFWGDNGNRANSSQVVSESHWSRASACTEGFTFGLLKWRRRLGLVLDRKGGCKVKSVNWQVDSDCMGETCGGNRCVCFRRGPLSILARWFCLIRWGLGLDRWFSIDATKVLYVCCVLNSRLLIILWAENTYRIRDIRRIMMDDNNSI